MKTLEIIHLRLAGNGPHDLVDLIRRSFDPEPGRIEVRIYKHAKLTNDFAIHVHRETVGRNDGASEVGIRLASLLRDHGMIDHTVWFEEPIAAKGGQK